MTPSFIDPAGDGPILFKDTQVSANVPGLRLPFVLMGSIFCLAIAMGVGRFAYTPLLPIMQRESGLGDDAMGFLASVHYAGYLIGAFVLRYAKPGQGRTIMLRVSLVGSIATTAAMGLTSSLTVWWIVRFLSGVASAGVFVLTSAIALDLLDRWNKIHLSGYVYGGVGAGIVMSGLAVPVLDKALGVYAAWAGLAALCLPLAWGSWLWVMDEGYREGQQAPVAVPAKLRSKPYLAWLTIAYFCEGLGFIVSGTFLVSIISNFSGSLSSANHAWILVGVAAAPSGIVWSCLGARIGLIKALISAYLLQSLGIVLPAVCSTSFTAYLGAVLFGGTFIGIAVLSLSLGKELAPQHSGRVIGMLTAVYGVGQILGPALGGLLAAEKGSFVLPLVGASLVVGIGAALLAIGSCFCNPIPRDAMSA